MQTATKKVAQFIAAELSDFDRRSPVEQMRGFLSVGRTLRVMVADEGTYGATAIQDIVERVPLLRDEECAYRIMALSTQNTVSKKFILEQTAVPMSNGQHLTFTHWFWVLRHMPGADAAGQHEWLLDELAWLRRESPSAAVIEHIEGVLEERHGRELETARERAREAIELLESL